MPRGHKNHNTLRISQKNQGYDVHANATIGSHFIIRQKSSFKYEVIDGEDVLDGADNVLLDQMTRPVGYHTKKKYSAQLRRIVYYATDLKRTFTFLTNKRELNAKGAWSE